MIELELSVEPFLVDPLELSVEALWTKFVVPLEKIVNRLSLVWNIVIQLKLLKDSPELSSAIEEVQVSLCPCTYKKKRYPYVLVVPFYTYTNSNLQLQARAE